MNPTATFERDLARWLEAEAPVSGPAGLNEAIIERAATLRQRPGWLAALRDTTLPSPARVIGWPAMPAPRLRFLLVVLGLVLALVVAAIAAGVFRSEPPPFRAPSWAVTGSLTTARSGHTATLLLDGRVLVAGGSLGDPATGWASFASAELYDPVKRIWTPTGSMGQRRYDHTATLLPDGRVLVAGDGTAELYDPVAGTWTATGALVTAHDGHTATLLGDGKVLVAGGYATSGASTSAELYDPASRTWTATGNMVTAHGRWSTATLLPDGRVLVAGGDATSGASTSAELYDPASGTWTATADMVTPNYGHTATLLPDGTVLVAGGGGRVPASCCAPSPHPAFVLPTAELYDPASGTWTATGDMKEVRNYHTATLLRDGKVLVAGGYGRKFVLASAELYDPATKSWTATSNLIEAHSGQTATLLPDGTVLLVGGGNGIYWFEGTSGGPEIADPELYDPGSGSGAIPSPSARMAPPAARPSPSLSVIEPAGPEWTATGTMVTARQGPTFTLLRDGKVLVFGGSHLITKELVLGARHLTSSGYEGLASADLYDPVGESWTAAGPMVTHAGGGFTATLLADGKVLVAGGNREGPAGDGSGNFTGEPLASAELFDPDSGAWTATGSMGEQRSSHTATLLPDGRVLVAGGDTAGWGAVASVELYDPASGTWTATASMLTPHVSHTATLLPDGKVLVVGGVRPIRASVELYDPASGTWTDTGSMSQPRTGHTATLLPDGTVLVAGGNSGVNGIDPLASVELYDPANRSWTVTGSMARPRTGHTATGHTATLLLDGRVLAVGGLDFRVMPGGELGRIISLASAELYDPASGSWTVTGNMSTPRDGHTAILLPDGRVLVAGGTNDGETLAYFELYDPRIATR